MISISMNPQSSSSVCHSRPFLANAETMCLLLQDLIQRLQRRLHLQSLQMVLHPVVAASLTVAPL